MAGVKELANLQEVFTMSELNQLPRIAVDEKQIAAAIGMSVGFLRKDRQTKRQIPFYRIGGCIRYDLNRVREALAAVEEGGAALRKDSKAKGVARV
jgi:hypothetical protein